MPRKSPAATSFTGPRLAAYRRAACRLHALEPGQVVSHLAYLSAGLVRPLR